jgi:WD40 repeat protein
MRAADPEDLEGPAIAFVLDLEDRVIRDLPWPDLRIRGTSSLAHGLRPLSWHPSGEKIVFRDRLGVIQVASIGGDEPHRLVGHEGASVLAVHPDGRMIASGGADGTLRLWPMPEGRPRHTLPREEFLDKLRSLTNYRVVADAESITGYRIEFGRLPGWDEVPGW